MLLTHSSKYSSPNTRMRVYTRHCHDLSKPPLLSPPLRTHVTLAHIDSSSCFLVVRAHAALRTIPTTPSTHFHRRTSLLPPHRPRLVPPDSKLSCSAPCNPLGGDSYYFHFSNSVGGREASVQHTLSHRLLFLCRLYSHPTNRLHHPLTCTPSSGGRPKEKYLYLSISSRATSPYSLPASTPRTPFFLLRNPPPPLLRFSLSFVLSFSFLFLLPLSPFYFHLPLLTAAPHVCETNEERE